MKIAAIIVACAALSVFVRYRPNKVPTSIVDVLVRPAALLILIGSLLSLLP